MSNADFGNPLKKFKLVFLGEQSGKQTIQFVTMKRRAHVPLFPFTDAISWQDVTHYEIHVRHV